MVVFPSSHQPPLLHFKGSIQNSIKWGQFWPDPRMCLLLHAAKWMFTNKSRSLPPAPFPLLMYSSWACALFHQSWSFPEVSGNHPSDIPREEKKIKYYTGIMEIQWEYIWQLGYIHISILKIISLLLENFGKNTICESEWEFCIFWKK